MAVGRAGPGPVGRPVRSGTVTAYDDARGLGVLTDTAGTEWPFHCTVIAGAARTVAVGAHVVFETAPGHLGRLEATAVTPGGGPGDLSPA